MIGLRRRGWLEVVPMTRWFLAYLSDGSALTVLIDFWDHRRSTFDEQR